MPKLRVAARGFLRVPIFSFGFFPKVEKLRFPALLFFSFSNHFKTHTNNKQPKTCFLVMRKHIVESTPKTK